MDGPTQAELFVEDIYDALTACVHALGGYKRVGAALRGPAEDPQKAGQWLAHCLQRERRERLQLHEAEWILRRAREEGCHVAMDYLCRACGYEPPKPTDAETEKAKLQREYVEAVRNLGKIAERLEHQEGLARDYTHGLPRHLRANSKEAI